MKTGCRWIITALVFTAGMLPAAVLTADVAHAEGDTFLLMGVGVNSCGTLIAAIGGVSPARPER